MDVAISRIAEASLIDKQITSDSIALLFNNSTDSEPLNPCCFQSKGCTWVGINKDRPLHRCAFDKIHCPSLKHGCQIQEERGKMNDHIPFCRFHPMICPCCGRKDTISSVSFSSHIEKKCPTFHAHIKQTVVDVRNKKNKKVTNEKQTWKFGPISLSHLERAFETSHLHSARLIRKQAEIRIGNGREVWVDAMDILDRDKENTITELYEEKDEETGETLSNGNPYNWHIDKLLEFVEEKGLRRAKKRKKQAAIVQDFLKRGVEKEYKKSVSIVSKQFQELEIFWTDRIKKTKWQVDSRLNQAKLNLSKRNCT